MYIRRKVFSSVYDEETGEERLFSTTEFMNEETYLEQRAYAEEAEEDAEAEAKKAKRKKIAKIAGASAGGAAVTAAGGIYGAKKIGELVEKGGREALNKANLLDKEAMKKAQSRIKVGYNLQKPAKKIAEAGEYVANKAKSAGEWTKNSKAGKFTAEQVAKIADWSAKHPKAVKGLKIGGYATAGTAAAAGAGYGAYKGYKAIKAKKEAKESAE